MKVYVSDFKRNLCWFLWNAERNARRHRAPDILSDSGDESAKDMRSPARTQSRQTTATEPVRASSKCKTTREQSGQDEHTDADNSDQESQEEQDDEVTDLQTHNRAALKSVFASEVSYLFY